MEQDGPGPTPHTVVAEQVRAFRRGRGWSAERLAEEMSAVGVPWSRVVVTKLETGRRPGVSVEELLALAFVLDVAPMHLLVPGGDQGEPCVYLPDGREANREVVREWIAGRRPIHGQDLNRFIAGVPSTDPDGFWDRFPRLREEIQGSDDGR